MAFETESTELDNLQPPTIPNSKPKTNGKSTSAPPPTAATAKVPTVKWGDAKVQSGDGLNRIKATTERQARFALIPGVDPTGQLTHFLNTAARKGYFACPGNGCPLCARGDDPRWLGAAIAVAYTNADANGKFAADATPTYAIGYISLSAAHFKTLSEASEGATPFDLDWVQSFDGKRFSLRPVALVPRYKKAGDEEAVIAMAKPFVAKLANKVGKNVTALALKQLLANAPTLEAGLEDMETE